MAATATSEGGRRVGAPQPATSTTASAPVLSTPPPPPAAKPAPVLAYDARMKRKEELRKRRNRMSAAESRKRKAEIVGQLEATKRDLGDVNACLSSTATLLKASNDHLLAQIKAARAALAARHGAAVAQRLCANATATACAATAASRPVRALAAGVGVPQDDPEEGSEDIGGADGRRAALAAAGAAAVHSSRKLLDFVSAPLELGSRRCSSRPRCGSGSGGSTAGSCSSMTCDSITSDDLAGVADAVLDDVISLGDIPEDATGLSEPELMAAAVPTVPAPAAAAAAPAAKSGAKGSAGPQTPWHMLLATPVEMVAVAPSPAPACIVSKTRGRGVPEAVATSSRQPKKARVGSLGGSPLWPSFV